MSTTTGLDTENPFRYPLGLPNGSVRALMTLIVVGVTCADIVQGKSMEPVWTETLMVALAYYFTSRRFIQLPPEILQRLETEGIIPKEPLPLHLPRGTIRIAILAALFGVAAYQYQHGKLFDKEVFPIFVTLIGYFAGTTVRSFWNWWYRGKVSPQSRWWADTKAVTVLGALTLTAVLQMIGQQHMAPIWLENITMALVLFYFGSR